MDKAEQVAGQMGNRGTQPSGVGPQAEANQFIKNILQVVSIARHCFQTHAQNIQAPPELAGAEAGHTCKRLDTETINSNPFF